MSISNLPLLTRAIDPLEERLENESESPCDRPLVGRVFPQSAVAVSRVSCFPSAPFLVQCGASLLKKRERFADGPE